jgi:hypothetical protein
VLQFVEMLAEMERAHVVRPEAVAAGLFVRLGLVARRFAPRDQHRGIRPQEADFRLLALVFHKDLAAPGAEVADRLGDSVRICGPLQTGINQRPRNAPRHIHRAGGIVARAPRTVQGQPPGLVVGRRHAVVVANPAIVEKHAIRRRWRLGTAGGARLGRFNKAPPDVENCLLAGRFDRLGVFLAPAEADLGTELPVVVAVERVRAEGVRVPHRSLRRDLVIGFGDRPASVDPDVGHEGAEVDKRRIVRLCRGRLRSARRGLHPRRRKTCPTGHSARTASCTAPAANRESAAGSVRKSRLRRACGAR